MPDSKRPDGHPMDAIAEQFKPSKTSPPGPASISIQTVGDQDPLTTSNADNKLPKMDSVSLPLDRIAAPAFFVDRRFNFRWMAPDGADSFSLALKSAVASEETLQIFKLLASRPLQASIADWQSLFSFVYTVLRRSMGDGGVDEARGPISDMDQTDLTDAVLDHRETLPLTMESCQLGDGAEETSWRLFGLGCEQGTLFVLRQDPWQRKPAFEPDENDVDPASHAAHRTTCVLVAQLNDSHRISDAMLPDGFRNWVNRVWEASDDVARAFAGTRSGVSGSRIYYVFKEVELSTSIFKAICCATRMSHRMQALEKRLLEQGEWAGDIRLNIGINHGEYLSADENAADSLPHMIPGDAFDQASLLAAIASAGEIWISKGTAAHLSASHIHQVVLGIEHQGTFLRNRFVRLTDLQRFSHSGHPASDTASLSAARIITVEHPGTDLPVSSEVQS